MKTTVVYKNQDGGWYEKQFLLSAKKLGFSVEIRDVLHDGDRLNDFGELVVWRSASLKPKDGRIEFSEKIRRGRILINDFSEVHRDINSKFFQQTLVSSELSEIKAIPTYRCDSFEELQNLVRSGTLQFPFVQKPDRGARGENIFLIRDNNDLLQICRSSLFEKQVYQNFIRNSGDYRVLVLYGEVLGIIKRVAKTDHFLNNVSQGGSAFVVKDRDIFDQVARMGAYASNAFRTNLCGVDVIFDEDAKEFHFLEINGTPQWKGFQEVTGINVSDEILIRSSKKLKNII